jgi:hypothetical protein
MFKKTVSFEDFNGVRQERDFYFHLSKAEFLAMATEANSMQERIKRIVEAQDGRGILNELREIIKLAVGIRSEDGQRFIKDENAKSQLLDSPAFDELLMELATNANASVDFVTQLIPQKMRDEMLERMKDAKSSVNNIPLWVKEGRSPTEEERQDTLVSPPVKDTENKRPLYQIENRNPTDAEVREMSQAELAAAFAWRQKNPM